MQTCFLCREINHVSVICKDLVAWVKKIRLTKEVAISKNCPASWPSYRCIGRLISLRYHVELVWLNWLTFIYTCWIYVFYPAILHLKVTEAAASGVLWKKYFAIFTGKQPFFKLKRRLIKSFIKKRLQHRCFPVNIAKFQEHLLWRTSVNGWINQKRNLKKTGVL